MKSDINRKLGDKIRQLRKERNLSQEDLAYLCNLHRTYIGHIERAEKNITIANLDIIAKAFGMNASQLLDFGERK